MDTPDQIMPNGGHLSTPPFMPYEIPDPSVRGLSWDELSNNRGVRFTHRKCVPCPNMVSLDTAGHLPNCKLCDPNGMIYYGAKIITAYLNSASMQKTYEYMGVFDQGAAMLTVPTKYDDGTECDVNAFDKLEMLDFEMRAWEIITFDGALDQKKIRYPIVGIEYMASAINNQLKVYTQGVNFNISADGDIMWVKGKTPQMNETLSISYLCKPVYVVLQIMREIRAGQEMQMDGTKIAKRFPQQVLIKKDFLINYEGKKA